MYIKNIKFKSTIDTIIMSATNRQKRRDLRLHATQTSMPKKEITPHLRWKMQTVRH